MQERFTSSLEINAGEVKVEEQPASDPNNSGRWTDQENFKYIHFLHKNKQRFGCKLKRRKIRLFEQMAEFIGSRSSIQCRTHHQKYEQKFGNAKNIINIYKQEVGEEQFKKKLRYSFRKEQFHKPAFENNPKDSKNIAVTNQFKEACMQTDPVEGLPELAQILRPTFSIPTMPQLWFRYYY